MRRILQCISGLNIGGGETMVMNVFRHIDHQKFQFDFVVFGDERGIYEDEAVELGANVYHITKRSDSFWRSNAELFRVVKAGGYSAVHIHSQNAFLASFLALVVKAAGVRTIIVHSHNTMDWRSRTFIVLHTLCRPLLNLLATKKLSCGEAAAEWLYGLTRGVQIIPLPVDCEKYLYCDRLRESFRFACGINEKTLVLSHTGRFSDVKNHSFLIDVFKIIVGAHPDSLLFLMGDGELKERTEEKVKTLGLSGKVVFFGNITDVNEKLILADAFLFPSKYEGFPTAVLEAQAAGLPCFISDTITEQIKITDFVWRLPIDHGAEVWADSILKSAFPSPDEKQAANSLIANDYDVKHVTEIFEKVYS